MIDKRLIKKFSYPSPLEQDDPLKINQSLQYFEKGNSPIFQLQSDCLENEMANASSSMYRSLKPNMSSYHLANHFDGLYTFK